MIQLMAFLVAWSSAFGSDWSAEANVAASHNAGHFAVLCRMYKLARHPPKIFLNATDEVERDLETLREIEAALSNNTWFEEVKAALNSPELNKEFKMKYPDSVADWKNWKMAVENVAPKDAHFQRITGESTQTRIALLKVNQIRRKAEAFSQSFKLDAVQKRMGEADTFLKKALWGEPGVEPDATADAGFKGDNKDGSSAQHTCGAGGSSHGLETAGTGAGASLLIDFLCLCAKSHSSGLEDACGAGTAATGVWAPQTGANGGANWKKIRDGCGDEKAGAPETLTEARDLIAEFISVVSAGIRSFAAANNHNAFIPGGLGTCNGCVGSGSKHCDGNKANGICVYYGRPGTWKDKIKWISNLRSGLSILEEIEAGAKNNRSRLTHFKMLKARAEEIYEEAKMNSELEKVDPEKPSQNQSQKQNPTLSTDKASAQDPNAVSTATMGRFILPWTLFI